MQPGQISPRIQGLIREGAQIALDRCSEWIAEFDRLTEAASPAVAEDSALAATLSQCNRATMIHFVTAMINDPAAPVPPYIGPETFALIREFLLRGLDATVLDIYRTGHELAYRRWTEIAFGLSTNADEVRELVEAPFAAVKEFVDATLAGIATHMQLEHLEVAEDKNAGRRRIVDLILAESVVNQEIGQDRLGYALDRSHTAAIIWCSRPGTDGSNLAQAASAFCTAVGAEASLTVPDGPETQWVWVGDIAAIDTDRIRQEFSKFPHARISIGDSGVGTAGFRRSHLQAQGTYRMVTRLQSHEQVAVFADFQFIALLDENSQGAEEFIKTTLGDFASASTTLHTTVLTYINEQCNASRAAKAMYTHRNTLLHRLETAQRLLPRPLEENTVQVAVAIQAVYWRGTSTDDATRQTAGRSQSPRRKAREA